MCDVVHLLWDCYELNDVQTDEDEDGACKVSFQHLVPLLAVPFL